MGLPTQSPKNYPGAIPEAETLPPAQILEDRLVPNVEIERALGQTVQSALDMDGWDQHAGLETFFKHAHDLVATNAAQENLWREKVQSEVLSRLAEFPDAPQEAGVYPVSKENLRDAYRHHLLSGDVTAVNGASTGHDGLAATLVSIGVCLVRYDGQLRSWKTTFLRHDYPIGGGDPIKEIKEFLDRRASRSSAGPGESGDRDHVTTLLRRGFMAAAERKALLQKTTTRWRLAHGTPAPLELLTGSGSIALIDEMLPILENLLLQEKRWVFLPSSGGNHALSTLANALDEGQIAIFQKGKPSLDMILTQGHFHHGYRRKVEDFAHRLGEAMVIGGFRATRHSPGQVFVAHSAHALSAGIIAMADASLQPHKGFPLLLDLAGKSAKISLGLEAFHSVVESAYAKAGASHLFAPERIMS